jgi:hypothetical protein
MRCCERVTWHVGDALPYRVAAKHFWAFSASITIHQALPKFLNRSNFHKSEFSPIHNILARVFICDLAESLSEGFSFR